MSRMHGKRISQKRKRPPRIGRAAGVGTPCRPAGFWQICAMPIMTPKELKEHLAKQPRISLAEALASAERGFQKMKEGSKKRPLPKAPEKTDEP